jgi:ABC-2 type transport system permease protein/lipopolysaccharide transport system permease protein
MAVESVIQQVPLPFSVHAYRAVCRNLIVLAHNAVIVPPVLLIFRVPVDWRIIAIVPALLLLSINGVWISMLFGMISARFRDVPPIVASFVQVVFFVTPVFWSADALGRWKQAVEFNPLFAAIDVIRAPLLATDPSPSSWPLLLGVTIVGSIGTFAFFARFRSRIAYWI